MCWARSGWVRRILVSFLRYFPTITWLRKFADRLVESQMKRFCSVSCQKWECSRLCSRIRNSSHALCVRRRQPSRKADEKKKTNCATLPRCVKRDCQSTTSERDSRASIQFFFVCEHLQTISACIQPWSILVCLSHEKKTRTFRSHASIQPKTLVCNLPIGCA